MLHRAVAGRVWWSRPPLFPVLPHAPLQESKDLESDLRRSVLGQAEVGKCWADFDSAVREFMPIISITQALLPSWLFGHIASPVFCFLFGFHTTVRFDSCRDMAAH